MKRAVSFRTINRAHVCRQGGTHRELNRRDDNREPGGDCHGNNATRGRQESHREHGSGEHVSRANEEGGDAADGADNDRVAQLGGEGKGMRGGRVGWAARNFSRGEGGDGTSDDRVVSVGGDDDRN